MKQDNSAPAPFDNIFEQMANISKATAYDVLVDQVKELKVDNDQLKMDKTDLLAALQEIKDMGTSGSRYDVLQIVSAAITKHESK